MLNIFFLKNQGSILAFVFYEHIDFFVYSVLCLLISCLFILIPYFLNGRKLKEVEKISEYECGFEPFDNATRQPFTIHFYIVGILFLIFDVEIALLFPWSIILLNIEWYGLFSMLFFLVILTIGFIYEWQIGAINWGPND
jgi:NADH-quinone oxidoreductase subunit A